MSGNGGPVIEQVKGYFHTGIERLRDRRRTTRRRLEDVFDRKTFNSIAVVGAMGKLIEKGVIPTLTSKRWPLQEFVAWVVVLTVALIVSVRWDRVTETAEAVGDVAEQSTEPNGETDTQQGSDTGGDDGSDDD